MKQDAAAAQIKENEPTSRRYFLLCQTCFWCASYIDIMGNMDDSHYKACSICNDNRIESLPISDTDRYHFEYTTNRGVLLEFLR